MYDKTDGIENNFLNTSVTNQYEFSGYIVSINLMVLLLLRAKPGPNFLNSEQL